jgi:hypothetical protein
MEKRKPTIKGVLKYGFEGLIAEVFSIDGSRKLGEICLSKDSSKIFPFLGFDYDRYLKGFDTVEEIFDYVVNSKFFNADGFMMDSLNHTDRKRNKKRATYQGFLEYINSKEPGTLPSYTFFKDKDLYIDMIDSEFPEANFKKQLEELKLEDEQNKIVSEKFNGDLVMEWTGLKDKELGRCLGEFKYYVVNLIGEPSFKEWVIKSEEIENIFKLWFTLRFEKK